VKSKLFAVVLTLASGLMLCTAFVTGAIAIWTVGPDAGRWGGTSFLFGFVGLFVAAGTAIAWDNVE
jgi:hypothetical protein